MAARDLTAQRLAFREKLDEHQRLTLRHKGTDWDVVEASPTWEALSQDPILQPPRQPITPSTQLLQRAAEYDVGFEAEAES